MRNYNFKNDSGQALLLVLLGMAVALTVVMSVVSRSITDISITSKSEEAARAFSAAEAGVEEALIVGSSVTSVERGYVATVSDVALNASFYNMGSLGPNESAVVWFASHGEDGLLICDATHTCFTGNTAKFCWGNVGTSTGSDSTPAVEVSFYYDSNRNAASEDHDYSAVRIARAAYDIRERNSFTKALEGCSIDTERFAFSTPEIDLSSLVPCSGEGCFLFAKVKLLYNYEPLVGDVLHKVGVQFGEDEVLPSQGVKIVSIGTSGEGSKATRKIEAIRPFKEPLTIFDAGVFSVGDLQK